MAFLSLIIDQTQILGNVVVHVRRHGTGGQRGTLPLVAPVRLFVAHLPLDLKVNLQEGEVAQSVNHVASDIIPLRHQQSFCESGGVHTLRVAFRASGAILIGHLPRALLHVVTLRLDFKHRSTGLDVLDVFQNAISLFQPHEPLGGWIEKQSLQ
eukprot:Skav226071  [mRNA]  locus=scaffold211:854438:861785:+ [translate_table: standard]